MSMTIIIAKMQVQMKKIKKKHKLKEQEQGRILTVFTILGKFTSCLMYAYRKLHILVSAMS